jgi:anti-anti-sigma factor
MTLADPVVLDCLDELRVAVDVRTGAVTVTGELDHCTAHLLTDVGHALASGRARAWSVDAAGLTFCDAGGLAALLDLRQQAAERGRTLHLVAAARCLRRLVALAGLADVLPVGPAPAPSVALVL